jgi:hypothetical protein
LGASLKDDTTDKKRTVNGQTICQRFAKSKELQPTAQSQRFAAHLLLPQPHDRQTLLQFITKQITN